MINSAENVNMIFVASSIVTIIKAQLLQEVKHYRTTKSLEALAEYYEDERNTMIATTEPEYNYLLQADFYEEMDIRQQHGNSMDTIFFSPPADFMRLDTETLLHILQYTQKYKIPISRTLTAWDMVTDGKTSAFLQGREFLAFGKLLNFVPEEDLYYANLGDSSVMNYFANHNTKLNKRKLGIIVASFKRYFGMVWVRNGSYIDEIGYMICGFPSYDLAKISPEVFREISVNTFSKLKSCSPNQTKTLYNVATHPDAYGNPYRWSSFEVMRIGELLTCLPTRVISAIQLEAVSAISEEVMKKMEQRKLEHFTRAQIMRMSPQTRRIFILRMQLRVSDVLGKSFSDNN